jgi:hypothetical protein
MKPEGKRRISKGNRERQNRSRFCFLIFTVCLLVSPAFAQPPTPLAVRLAVVDFAGDAEGEVASLLRSLSRDAPALELLDEQLVRAAVRGAGYAGDLNLSLEEARALGLSLGCEFYLLGKVQTARRLEAGEQSHFESLAGLFLVETRTGRLVLFRFERATSKAEAAARGQLIELVRRGWKPIESAIASAQASQQARIANAASMPLIEIAPDAVAAGPQPVFFERLKPAYTESAEAADIAATIELEASFQFDGRVGEIEVLRWAGFGLEESAIATLRQLRFKPAERDGKGITIRGLVRYNFLRPRRQADRPMHPSEIERLKRTLRELKSPGSIPGQRPNF